uniref:Uncharacterized protein n=1 Tax=Chromera velia CCMP2878 TaxID=1169474 RepID=A0A0G4HPG7_9ALVE|eukprot:Cvel_7765.t1-p1 / transcript=Cvel_7765.t1 / gene=Cvel_7765 / organism=Chromera_velia_CCMP2878 / gene_product=hypothetical protein / transcript_product=hypothetical protein / location=Cvel_scaffold414:50-2025(-) / protein_length=192 / sequence_SO=supercontig / SO=protein_coding / is_pseudo=false
MTNSRPPQRQAWEERTIPPNALLPTHQQHSSKIKSPKSSPPREGQKEHSDSVCHSPLLLPGLGSPLNTSHSLQRSAKASPLASTVCLDTLQGEIQRLREDMGALRRDREITQHNAAVAKAEVERSKRAQIEKQLQEATETAKKAQKMEVAARALLTERDALQRDFEGLKLRCKRQRERLEVGHILSGKKKMC